MNVLGRFDLDRSDRELYKLLHKKVTVKLEAASVMTCAAGKGFELYRMINKRLDPNNAISEHTHYVGGCPEVGIHAAQEF